MAVTLSVPLDGKQHIVNFRQGPNFHLTPHKQEASVPLLPVTHPELFKIRNDMGFVVIMVNWDTVLSSCHVMRY